MIKNPPIKYYGAKWRLAPWIISHFPRHTHYIEVCGGAAGVLLQKPRSKLETYNDSWGAVVNFFRVLRNNEAELIRKIELTPWAREEYKNHYEPTDDPVEAARRFWIGCNMSIGSMAFSCKGMRVRTKKVTQSPQISTWSNLLKVSSRLKGVQIESLHYADLLERYEAPAPQNLFYFDPPYTSGERVTANVYNTEWSNDDHKEAAEILRNSKAYVIVSGYKSESYKELYEDYGWRRIDKATQTNGGSRVESLWLNPACANTGQLKLF